MAVTRTQTGKGKKYRWLQTPKGKEYTKRHNRNAATRQEAYRKRHGEVYLKRHREAEVKRRKTPESRRAKKNSALMKAYGITVVEFERLIKEQGSKCRICLIELDKGFYTAVDHDHETGIVRGILCSRCNLALGGFRDDAQIVQRAADYLNRKDT